MWFTHLMEGMDDYHLDNCQQSSSWLWLHVHILLKETWYLYCLNNNGLKIKIFWYSEYMNIDKIWQRLIFKFPNLMPWSLSTPQNHESLRMMNEKPYHNKCKSKLEMRNQNNTKKSIKTGKKKPLNNTDVNEGAFVIQLFCFYCMFPELSFVAFTYFYSCSLLNCNES